MKKTTAKKTVKGSDTYKLDRVKSFVKIEQKGTITAKEAIENIAEILEVYPIIKISEMEYKVSEWKDNVYLESRNTDIHGQKSDWGQVEDLTELKVWEYNELVDEFKEHYRDYPIEYLEGRFV